MREYELTYLVSDEVLEKDHKIITDRVAGIISDEGGKVSKEETWGRRKLTYPIKKQNFATYVTVWFRLPKEKIGDIEHELQVHPQIIRHLIVVKVAKSDPSRLARRSWLGQAQTEAEAEELVVTKEDIVGTQDVEKVIGEKSFEQIEGQKDKSYDLMAKREIAQPEETEKLKNLKTKKQRKEKEDIEPEVEKKAKKIIKKEVITEKPVEIKTEAKIEPPIEKPRPKADQPVAEKEEKKDDEADRIKKLDEKLDEILKE